MGVAELYARQDAFTDPGAYAGLLTLTNRYTSAWDSWRDDSAANKALNPTILAAVDSVVGIIRAFETGTCGLALLEKTAEANLQPPWQVRA